MIRETVRSEMVMPSIFSSPWIRGARQSGLAAAIRSISWRISAAMAGPPRTAVMRSRQSCPELTKAFPLPAGDSVRPDVHQRATPTGPPLAECDPEHSIESRQKRSFPLSLEGGELEAQCPVLNSNGLVSDQPSHESNDAQQED